MKAVDLDNYVIEKIKENFKGIQHRYSYYSQAYRYYEFLLFDEINVDVIIDKNIENKRIIDFVIDENVNRIRENLKDLSLKINRMVSNEVL